MGHMEEAFGFLRASTENIMCTCFAVIVTIIWLFPGYFYCMPIAELTKIMNLWMTGKSQEATTSWLEVDLKRHTQIHMAESAEQHDEGPDKGKQKN